MLREYVAGCECLLMTGLVFDLFKYLTGTRKQNIRHVSACTTIVFSIFNVFNISVSSILS